MEGRYSAKEVQGVIGRSNFVLAERLHGSIMAINTGVPLLSIAYMPKVNGVLELSNLTDCIIEMHSFLNGDALDSIVSRVNDQIHLAPEEALCKDMKTRAEQNFEKLLLLR
ncbi:MAG: polysaccharide pyruvyl transferase family protein [Cellvibrio sp.]|nr:polysaccharide pyruvyl transferase family protein [Cellvibrio sp.]